MNKFKLLPLSAMVMIMLAALTACHDDDDDEEDENGTVIGQVEYEFFIRNQGGNASSQFSQGEPIHFVYQITNDSSDDANFIFPSGLPVEVDVYEDPGTCSSATKLVWTYSNEFKNVDLPQSELYLEPSDQETFTIIWDQLDNNDTQITGNTDYCVEIRLNGTPASSSQLEDGFLLN